MSESQIRLVICFAIWVIKTNKFLFYYFVITAKGRTNVELREQFTLAAGVSQSMAPFKSKPSFSGPSPDAASSVSGGGSGQRPSMSGPITKVRTLRKLNRCNTNRLFFSF